MGKPSFLTNEERKKKLFIATTFFAFLSFGQLYGQGKEYSANEISHKKVHKSLFLTCNVNAAFPLKNFSGGSGNYIFSSFYGNFYVYPGYPPYFHYYGIDQFSDPYLAHAQTGIDANFNIVKCFHKYVGISTSFGYSRNYGLCRFPLAMISNNPPTRLGRVNYTDNGYHQIYALTGVLLTVPYKFISFDFRIQVGPTKGIDGESKATYLDIVSDDTLFMIQPKVEDISPMFSMGFSTRFLIIKHLVLAINVDLRHAKYQFKVIDPVRSPALDYPYTMNTTIGTVGGSIGYYFTQHSRLKKRNKVPTSP